MPTKIVGPAPSDYGTLTEWEATIVNGGGGTLTEDHVAAIKNYENYDTAGDSGGQQGRITITGFTTTATARVVMRAAEPSDDPLGTYGITVSQKHNGKPGTGARVKCVTPGGWGCLNFTSVGHVLIQNLAFNGDGVGSFAIRFANSPTSVLVENCLAFAMGNGFITCPTPATELRARNNLVIAQTGIGMVFANDSGSNPTRYIYENNTVIGKESGTYGGGTSAFRYCIARNNAVHRFNDGASGWYNFLNLAAGSSNNMSSDISPVIEAANRSKTADACFVAPNAAGGWDLIPKVGSPLIDAGTTIAGLTYDISGTARPQGTAFDIGAFEKASTSGTTHTESTSETASAYSSASATASRVTAVSEAALSVATSVAIANKSAARTESTSATHEQTASRVRVSTVSEAASAVATATVSVVTSAARLEAVTASAISSATRTTSTSRTETATAADVSDASDLSLVITTITESTTAAANAVATVITATSRVESTVANSTATTTRSTSTTRSEAVAANDNNGTALSTLAVVAETATATDLIAAMLSASAAHIEPVVALAFATAWVGEAVDVITPDGRIARSGSASNAANSPGGSNIAKTVGASGVTTVR